MPTPAGDTRTAALGLGGVLVLLLVGFGFWRVTAHASDLEARVAQEAADSSRFATTIELVNALRARQDTIQQKIDVIRSVDRRRYVWPHLMDEVSRAVPQYTWLTSISASEPAAPPAPADSTAAAAPAPVGPRFTIEGNAGSTQALTRFMKNLEASPFIREVTLVTSEQTVVENRTIHRFSLEATYETPDSGMIETVPIIVTD